MRLASRMNGHTLGTLALLCADLARFPTAAGQAATPAALAGVCYDLSLGPWRPRPLAGPDSIYIAPPSRVRFDTVRSERSPDRFALATPPGALPSVHRYAWWRPVDGDRVELLWSTGYSGLRMTLGGAQGELRGEARAFWDFPSDPLTADAVARRVACDGPAHPSATDQRFVFRAVPVAGGDSVAPGMPIGAVRSRADSLRGRTFRMRGAPGGPFARAASVEFSVNRRDTVWRVEVLYPEDADFESIATSFTRMLGAPLWRDTTRLGSGEVGSVHVSWGNRTTQLTLRRSALFSGRWRTGIMLVDPRIRP
jgi:hypothetical protein